MTTLEQMLTRLNRSATWLRDAACADRLDIDWDPPNSPSERIRRAAAAPALRLCDSCPVRQQCLEDALTVPAGEDWGIRGGTTRGERIKLRKDRPGTATLDHVHQVKRVERWRQLMHSGLGAEEAARRVGHGREALDRAWHRMQERAASAS